jgi:hypothetical protein
VQNLSRVSPFNVELRLTFLAAKSTRKVFTKHIGELSTAIISVVSLRLVFLKLQPFVRRVVADLDTGQRDGSLETIVAGFSYGHNKFVAVEHLAK